MSETVNIPADVNGNPLPTAEGAEIGLDLEATPIYAGSFLSVKGNTWTVKIFRDGFSGQTTGIEFPQDRPLEIAWEETDKLEPLACSSATLKIISDTDREFIDLYTVQPGSVRLEVYRNGGFYWSGCLDTELYEEPYSRGDGYDVTLTFSDFAVLDRYVWQNRGTRSMEDIIYDCIDRANLKPGLPLTRHISTEKDGSPVDLSDLILSQDNFFDEDDEPMSVREVLEGVLRPFALRLQQKAGGIYVYDINALSELEPKQVVWDNDDSTLSMDRVYNNVELTFSPYADTKAVEGKVERDKELESGHDFRVDYARDSQGRPTSLEGFTICLSDEMKSNLQLSNGATFFQINPEYSGSEEQGVIYSLRAGLGSTRETGVTTQVLNDPKNCGAFATGVQTIITMPRLFVAKPEGMVSMLRLNLDLLFDTRYNPFEDASDDNEAGKYDKLREIKLMYMPVKITLEDEAGNALYHYSNYSVLVGRDAEHTGKVAWRSGPALGWSECWLAWHDNDKLEQPCAGGWQTNSNTVPYFNKPAIPANWKKMDRGEYIPLPPIAGYIKVEIGDSQFVTSENDIFQWVRWIAYRNPTISICKANGKALEVEDIIDRAYINRAAKEDLGIETIVGTMPADKTVTSARGLIYDNGLKVIGAFRRAGVTGRLERLLIGTAYSHYGTRHLALSGSTELERAFNIYSDAATAGKFMALQEIQDIIQETEEMTMVQINEDNYEGVEYE